MRVKSKSSSYNASTLKIHPLDDNTVNNAGFDVLYDEARYRYLLSCLNSLAIIMNTRDLKRLETLVHDICLENCSFKGPALKVPVVGRENVIEFYRSIMRASEDIKTHIHTYSEEKVGNSVVLSSHYISTGV